jgi:chaperonin cofactor prefoldin
MDIKKLWEHYENMVAQDDHLRRSITELENERADVQAEIRETLTAIESIQGEIDWG